MGSPQSSILTPYSATLSFSNPVSLLRLHLHNLNTYLKRFAAYATYLINWQMIKSFIPLKFFIFQISPGVELLQDVGGQAYRRVIQTAT